MLVPRPFEPDFTPDFAFEVRPEDRDDEVADFAVRLPADDFVVAIFCFLERREGVTRRVRTTRRSCSSDLRVAAMALIRESGSSVISAVGRSAIPNSPGAKRRISGSEARG